MKRIPKAVYAATEELEERIKLRQEQADNAIDAMARQSILNEIAQLRVYAEAKRWMSPPSK